jgi:hypothetical protein
MALQTDDELVVCRFRPSEWHGLLRDSVYCVSSLEKYLGELARGADPRRDAWVLALSEHLAHVVEAQDAILELLHEANARPDAAG